MTPAPSSPSSRGSGGPRGRGGPGGGRGGPGGGHGGRGGDRRRGGHQREPSEYAEATLSLDRVTRVVKGGRRMRFRAVVVVGNRKGKVGLGTGKAAEVQAAIRKASSAAKRHLIRIPIVNGTIPHPVEKKFKAARLRLIPATPGTGIIAGGALRVILDHAGVKDVLSKRFGSRNKLVNAQATMLALEMLRGTGGPDVTEKAADAPVNDDSAPGIEVKQMDRKDLQQKLDDQRRNRIEQ